MKTKRHTGVIFFALALLALAISAAAAAADEIVLDNGDRLSGTVVRAEGGKLTLKTDYAGVLAIPMKRVRKIVTDNPAEVHLAGGEVLRGRIRTTEGGQLVVEPSPERGALTVEISRVASINPLPPARLTGNVSLGSGWQSGNTDRATMSASADAVVRAERNRFGVRFLFNYAEESDEVTTRNLFGAMKYDYFFTKKFYGYLGVEMLKDRFKDLDLRTVAGPGVGYQIWDDPGKFFLVEAGLAYFSEDRRIAEDDSWVAARLAGEFRYAIFERLTFSDRLELYPSLENSDDFNLRNEAAILSPLAAGWSLKLSHILEYDNDPPADVSKTDQYWTLGLQYSF